MNHSELRWYGQRLYAMANARRLREDIATYPNSPNVEAWRTQLVAEITRARACNRYMAFYRHKAAAELEARQASTMSQTPLDPDRTVHFINRYVASSPGVAGWVIQEECQYDHLSMTEPSFFHHPAVFAARDDAIAYCQMRNHSHPILPVNDLRQRRRCEEMSDRSRNRTY